MLLFLYFYLLFLVLSWIRLKFLILHLSVHSWRSWNLSHLSHRCRTFVLFLLHGHLFWWFCYMCYSTFYILVVFSVIMTDSIYQLLRTWKGTWSSWLNAWKIFCLSKIRYYIKEKLRFSFHDIIEWYIVKLKLFFEYSFNIIIGTSQGNRRNSKHGFRSEGK